MRQRRDKTPGQPEGTEPAANPQTEPARPLVIDEDKVFVVHGKKNPEGGIRRWREAEHAEVAVKTLYPKGAPDSLSDSALAGIVNVWLNQNTDWLVLKRGVLKRGEVSRETARRVRKLPRG